MNHQCWRLTGIALASLISLPACGEAPAPSSSTTDSPSPATTDPPEHCAILEHALQKALDVAIEDQQIPGATASVDRGPCRFRGASGLANRENPTPMKPNDLFRIGSITKSFVATVILMLDAEGKVSLDQPVSNYISGVPDGESVTVRQTLNHTSGIYNFTESVPFWETLYANPTRKWRPEELLAIAEGKAYFAPGQGWHYSNTNYIIAGMIAETCDGRPLAQQIRQRILEPLGLAHTYFDGDEPAIPGLIHGYEPALQGPGLDDATVVADPSWAWAAGAMVSNTDDLAIFFDRLFSGQILDSARLTEMTTWATTTWPQIPGYGLGLSQRIVPGGFGQGHEGGVMGYVTAGFQIPELDAHINVFTNFGYGDAAAIVVDLAKVLETQPLLDNSSPASP